MSSSLPEKQSSRKAAKYRGVECLNCGHPLDLSDVYCSYCGQLNSKKKLSLIDFFNEFLSSLINYDSRLRYTLKDLLFKPGTITKNYALGQRLKYANPFRFFLSVSIAYFLIQGLIATVTGESTVVNFNESKSPITFQNDSIISLANKNIPKDQNITFGKDTLILGKDTIPMNVKENEDFRIIPEAELDTMPFPKRIAKRFSLYNDFYETSEIKDPVKALDSLGHENTAYNRWVYNKNEALERIEANPYGFANYLITKIPFFLFFFAPFFAFFFWLIYSKKKYTYMEHLVFIFHILGFVFLGLLLCLVPDLIFGNEILLPLFLIFIGPFYFYKALRNFYGQSRFVTILKFIFLNVVFTISAFVIAFLFFAVTAAAY